MSGLAEKVAQFFVEQNKRLDRVEAIDAPWRLEDYNGKRAFNDALAALVRAGDDMKHEAGLYDVAPLKDWDSALAELAAALGVKEGE